MSQGQATQSKQEIGAAVGDFSLPRIGGEGHQSLSHSLDGKRGCVVVFWSGICSHCVRYDPYLNAFGARHPEIGLVVVASRHGESAEMIAATMAERKLSFTILHDPPGAVAREWFTQQTPRAFLLDSSRRLLYRGAIDNFKFPEDPEFISYLEPAISQFLAGQPIARAETASFGCAIQSVYYILPKPL